MSYEDKSLVVVHWDWSNFTPLFRHYESRRSIASLLRLIFRKNTDIKRGNHSIASNIFNSFSLSCTTLFRKKLFRHSYDRKGSWLWCRHMTKKADTDGILCAIEITIGLSVRRCPQNKPTHAETKASL